MRGGARCGKVLQVRSSQLALTILLSLARTKVRLGETDVERVYNPRY
jgi:hypothetical protein